MRYLALACDYYGTLAWHNHVADRTVAALERLRISGRKLILVTGRRLDELLSVLGLELCVLFNRGAVMVLPSGITKASGLAAALEELELSHHNVAGIGDSESDHSFLRL